MFQEFDQVDLRSAYLVGTFITMSIRSAEIIGLDINPALKYSGLHLTYIKEFQFILPKHKRYLGFYWKNPAGMDCSGIIHLKHGRLTKLLLKDNLPTVTTYNPNFICALKEAFYCFQKILCGEIRVSVERDFVKTAPPAAIYQYLIQQGIYTIFFQGRVEQEDFMQILFPKKESKNAKTKRFSNTKTNSSV